MEGGTVLLWDVSVLVQVYLLRDGKTGVVVLSTFDSGEGKASPAKVLNEAAKSFSLANR